MRLDGAPEPAAAPSRPLWRRILGERPDETVLRVLFHGLVASTVFVLGYDLVERMQAPPPAAPALLPGEMPDVRPYLPPARVTGAPDETGRPANDRLAELREPMTIELLAGGRLEATGTIAVGTAAQFAAEIEKRGDYVKTVVLNSPGGSVQDALAMAKLIRKRRLDTEVGAEGLCASSCPLVFAGGVVRTAEPGAAIGVHQVIALLPPGALPSAGGPDVAMTRAQQISAECQRHLVDMGVDPRVWIHAMETPPEQIFYFTPEELTALQLATGPSVPLPVAKRG